ncbi:helix-turn-helix domain-containing protein [Streptomyces sp. NPDC096080]|uniref:winged helix-turn-helix transcriptional regulator n=1 Tax=Streptomyces sp. NPDC096080 TaxID=3156693 RepID=UPI00331DA5A2
MRSSVEEAPEYCAIEFAMEVLGGRWKLAILKQLVSGTHRFGELRRALPGITQRMLTRQLRELEADGLVTRTVHREVPPRVEYALTDVGRSLDAITAQLDTWGRWYQETVRRTPAAGAGTEPAATGSHSVVRISS